MLRIGYLSEGEHHAAHRQALEAAGCQVLRIEPLDGLAARRQLTAILNFLNANDRLVVPELRALGGAQEIIAILDDLRSRGAVLEVLEPAFDSAGPAGMALGAALSLAAPTALPTRKAKIDAICDLHAAGLGPTQIAKQLGVSRMSVWRVLRNLDEAVGQAGAPSPAAKVG
jgi:DNA invertase Pin-like site-specific DNA recombinase